MNKIIEMEQMEYRVIPVDDHYVVVDETGFGMVAVSDMNDAEDKLRRHLSWCSSHEE